ncbi:MAG TPA: ATP-binding protein, partial [bacterium]|nr:ATP-binding protein [bacterium]
MAIEIGGAIRLVNAKTEEQFGYRREELLGQPLEILMPEGLRAQHVAHRAEYFQAPRSRPMGMGMELKGRKKDGTEFPVEISLSFVREQSGQLALALITDISERKRLDEQMRQTQRMESLGVLAGGVAHDFNNLLTGIMGNASLVQEHLAPDTPAYRQVEDVLHSAQQAADLTRQLLAYAGKGQFYITSVDMAAVVRETLGLMRSSIPAAVRVKVRLQEALPPVSGDRGQLQQLFTNLLWNAVEAIGTGSGTVEVGAETVETDEPISSRFSVTAPPGKYVAVEVTDSGCGMDEATIARIFDPFFTTKFTGRGLGLSASRGIVQAHHGGIRVASNPGQGSTFTILLPVARAKAVSGASSARPATEDCVVLVVDD